MALVQVGLILGSRVFIDTILTKISLGQCDESQGSHFF